MRQQSFQNNIKGFGRNIPPQWGRIENFASRENFLLGDR